MRIAVVALLTTTALLAAHLYANPEEVRGYRTGDFDDHAIIANELLETEASGLGDRQTNRAVSDRRCVFSRIRE
jgi:hypothetical protein